jgi:FlaA1/EpsC-like NDP-sugar epimerase
MGLSKRIVEMAFYDIFARSNFNFITIRFGNVIGSKGSVFDKFTNQIINKQKISLTSKTATRFFMNISDAASLIIKISTFSTRNKIFILNMGKPILIYEMVKNLILKFGKEEQEKDITIVGLKDGEKTHEELYYEEEKVKKFDDSIFVGTHIGVKFRANRFLKDFEKLQNYNDDSLRGLLSSIEVI